MRLVPNEFSWTSLMSTVSIPSTEPSTIFCTIGCASMGSSKFRLSSVLIATSGCVYDSVVAYSPIVTPAVSCTSDVRFVNALST